ncbi:hypothetical protein ZOD2009_09118 [Haladaptatus paucihalophilus DX253]|uniref:TMEM205-like domain-containing protein n=1 Tax=Haladaptatus paucihalophilus DX253 TaxID=797209 RepID=E7QSP8_HALPU|nr:DUF4149 domain-containing protein [Haladaptatus paucihalophilus]EFW92457.1 hypothetical protein ZOD2009_09118 [Haladaptatus paucihalophilus DX253]SHK06683.1 protein of unknown function [Haladaptatus paucihalophilus DX253]
MTLLGTGLLVVADAALGIWLGSIVFFSFIGAPTTFDVLDDDAGQVVNAIFPKYYQFGLGLGVVAFGAAVVGTAMDAFDGIGVAALALVGVVFTGYARWVLIPKMEAVGDDAFAQYHKQSVVLNGLTMLAVAGGIVASHL